MASRVATSQLLTLGCPELVTKDRENYQRESTYWELILNSDYVNLAPLSMML